VSLESESKGIWYLPKYLLCVVVVPVGAKQVSSASPAFDLRGNKGGIADKGKAGETFALPLRLKTVYQKFLRLLTWTQNIQVI
jgi:hypothetical protein